MEMNYGIPIQAQRWEGYVPLKYRLLALLYGRVRFYSVELLHPNDWVDVIIATRPMVSKHRTPRRHIVTEEGPLVIRDGKLMRTAQYAVPLPF